MDGKMMFQLTGDELLTAIKHLFVAELKARFEYLRKVPNNHPHTRVLEYCQDVILSEIDQVDNIEWMDELTYAMTEMSALQWLKTLPREVGQYGDR